MQCVRLQRDRSEWLGTVVAISRNIKYSTDMQGFAVNEYITDDEIW